MRIRVQALALLICAGVLLVAVSGCKESGPPEPTLEEQLLGTWSKYYNKMYILLRLKANGVWTSDARVEGANSRIIDKKWAASGTWRIEDRSLVVDVTASDSSEFWIQGRTIIFELLELNTDFMTLKHPNGREFSWQKAQVKQRAAAEGAAPSSIKMKPLVVNLNKNRSHDKDRYLCLDLELNLRELMEDEEVPVIHPQAREAAILFLSSLVYKDVKSFDLVKAVNKELEKVLNPYLDGKLKEIKINHVVIASSMDKVDEFLIGHTPVSDVEEAQAEGEGTESEKDK